MKNLLVKECRLAAATITYFFLAAGLLTLIPGYPILMGVFFTCLGIFYSFQTMRENRDIEYSMLLPVSKAEVVKGKFLFVMLLQGCSFLVMALVTVVRAWTRPNELPLLLRLRGLDPCRRYRVEETGECYEGDELMRAGLCCALDRGDAAAMVFTLQGVN